MKIKGFKNTGNGPKLGHSFSTKSGFSGSTGKTQNVRGYTRAMPKACYAEGGAVSRRADSALIDRSIPVTQFDKESGGKTPLRPGFKGGGFIQKAIKHPGALHKALGVPQGEKIPAKKLAKAAHSDNPTMRKRANLAKTLKSFNKKEGGMVDKDCYATGGMARMAAGALGRVLAAQGQKTPAVGMAPPQRFQMPAPAGAPPVRTPVVAAPPQAGYGSFRRGPLIR